jgi:four helix bundle protein
MKICSYQELIVWQKSILLVKAIYKITADFPKTEQYGISNQIRRCTISIPSNIAEGYGRRSHKEYLQFFSVAYGSALELETQLIISTELSFVDAKKIEEARNLLTEVIKMLYVLVYKERSSLLA